MDSVSSLTLKTYALKKLTTLKKRKERKDQFYLYRRYSKIPWVLNKDIPLMVYASSWHDKKFNVERFCGVLDLSYNDQATQELFNNSPHYFLVSYKISE